MTKPLYPSMKQRCACHIPVFQPDDSFVDCLRSLSLCDPKPYLIVVDDASSEPISLDLEEYSLEGELIRLPSNQGVSAASNVGIRRALDLGFEFIARVDSDDLVAPDRFGRQLRSLDDNPAALAVFTSAAVIDDAANAIGTWRVPRDTVELQASMARNNCLCTSSAMFRKEFFERYGFYDETLRNAEDYALFLRPCLEGRIALLNEILVSYRVQGNGLSFASYRQQLANRWKIQARALQMTGWRGAEGLARTSLFLGACTLMPTALTSSLRSRFGLRAFDK